jgi:hypothetical protein
VSDAKGILLVGGLAFVACAAVGFGIQIPEPWVHDEFSYLLAADTFAHGRLTNPTPPRWMHFETFHVIQQPTYASKFPPAQGLVLAFGQMVLGHPIAGVWLSSAAACAAIAWMLLAWLPRRWAWTGTAIAILSTSIVGSWAQSYWGGAVAAAGGALVYGGLRRLVDGAGHPVREATLLGFGLVVLALSRPFEGLLTALPALLLLCGWGMRALAVGRRLELVRAAVPVFLIGGLGLAWLGYYDWKVTGDPLRPPYQLYLDAYGTVPPFLFLPLETTAYRHRPMERMHGQWERRQYESQQPWPRRPAYAPNKLAETWKFFLGVAGTLALLGLPWALGDRWNRLALGVCLLVVATNVFAVTFANTHYFAPLTALLVLLQVQGLRQLLRAPPLLSRILAAVLVAALAWGFRERLAEHPTRAEYFSETRAEIIDLLDAQPGDDLVLTWIEEDQPFHDEWVFNGADLPGAGVVFARAIGPDSDARLIAAFPNRRIWRLTVSLGELRLQPHPADQPSRPSPETTGIRAAKQAVRPSAGSVLGPDL